MSAERDLRQRLGRRAAVIARLRKRLEARNAEIARLRAAIESVRRRAAPPSIRPEQAVWIFGGGRTGSTWLGRMLGDLPGGALWNEPAVGALFGDFRYYRYPHRRDAPMIMSEAHEAVWLRAVRSLVLEGAAARFPRLAGHVAIKEPHGTIGAPLLSRAIPESRLLLLVRDPRDVLASSFDAHRQEGWARRRRGGDPALASDRYPETFVRFRTQAYVWDLEKASEAYSSHPGPKALVRYEDLCADPHAVMRRACGSLELTVEDADLARVTEIHAWGNLPDEEKGPGKFYRRGTPGSWQEDLSDEQQRLVEEIALPVLDSFYPGWEGPDGTTGAPSPDTMASRAGDTAVLFPWGSRQVLDEIVRILLGKLEDASPTRIGRP